MSKVTASAAVTVMPPVGVEFEELPIIAESFEGARDQESDRVEVVETTVVTVEVEVVTVEDEVVSVVESGSMSVPS